MDTGIALWMSEDQIVALYRDARHRSAEVKILSELNACSPATIKMILAKHGLAPSQSPRRYGDDRLSVEQVKTAKRMRSDGATYRRIAEEIGAPMWAVRYYLNKLK